MHFSALVLFLVSSLSITAALPVPGSDSNSENGRAVNTLFSKNGIWAFHDGSRGPLDHKSGPGNLETINIPPAAIDNPCYNKGPLQCPPLTPNPVTSIPHLKNCVNESNRFGTQGTFDSLWNVERILTPVGILVVMVSLGFVAVGLVAIVDYVWVRWGRGYSGYPGIGVVEVGDEEKAEAN